MKKTLIALTATLGLAITSYGQGYIYLNNLANVNANTTGQFYTTDVTQQEGGGSTLMGMDFCYAIYASSTQNGAFSLVAEGDTSGEIAGDNPAYGALQGPSAAQTVGTGAITSAFFEIYAWAAGANDTILFSSYAAAVAGGGYVADSGIFSNPVGTSATSPTTPSLVSMPDMTFAVVSTPEPTTIALAGLGIAGLVALRRKK